MFLQTILPHAFHCHSPSHNSRHKWQGQDRRKCCCIFKIYIERTSITEVSIFQRLVRSLKVILLVLYLLSRVASTISPRFIVPRRQDQRTSVLFVDIGASSIVDSYIHYRTLNQWSGRMFHRLCMYISAGARKGCQT